VRHLLLAAALLAPAASGAQEARFCPNRPDLGASACTTDPGRLLVELSGVDWERDDSADAREDRIVAGDLLARLGIGPRTEVQVSWAAYGRVRTRDKTTGTVETVSGTGDIRLGLRQNLRNPDGDGLSFAVEPFVTLPVGTDRIGAGDWSAGAVLPVSYDLGHKLGLSFTGTLQAAVDEDGQGRHFLGDATLGLGYDLSDSVSAVGEVAVTRDDDPLEPRTEWVGALSFAWQPRPNRQIDVLAVAGLNRDAPDVRLVVGGAVRF
jgi:hypothetical protein